MKTEQKFEENKDTISAHSYILSPFEIARKRKAIQVAIHPYATIRSFCLKKSVMHMNRTTD